MIVKLNKCHNCGILREASISGECAVCGCHDFTQVLFCDKHHAEAHDGTCQYCLNEQKSPLRVAAPKTTTQQPDSSYTVVQQPMQAPPKPPKLQNYEPPPFSRPEPKIQPTAPTAPTQPTTTKPPVVQTEKSGMGCWGCLFWTIVVIIIAIVLMNMIS